MPPHNPLGMTPSKGALDAWRRNYDAFIEETNERARSAMNTTPLLPYDDAAMDRLIEASRAQLKEVAAALDEPPQSIPFNHDTIEKACTMQPEHERAWLRELLLTQLEGEESPVNRLDQELEEYGKRQDDAIKCIQAFIETRKEPQYIDRATETDLFLSDPNAAVRKGETPTPSSQSFTQSD
jgi:hypothetical protein